MVTGTAMLWVVVVIIAVIMGVSLYRRIAKPKEKHMHTAIYWPLFIVGLLVICGQIISLMQTLR